MKNLNKREIMIQRLVSNELTMLERASFLAEVKQYENGWQEIALAFIEEQVFSNACNDDRQSSSGLLQQSVQVEQVDVCWENCGHLSSLPSRAISRTTNAQKGTWRVPPWIFAASVLISLLGGMLISDSIHGIFSQAVAERSSEIPSQDTHFENERQNDTATLEEQESDHLAARENPLLVSHSTLKFPNPETGETTEIPMFDLESLFGFAEPSIPQELLETLHHGGFRLEPKTHFVHGQLPDHREVVVPVRQWSLQSYIQ